MDRIDFEDRRQRSPPCLEFRSLGVDDAVPQKFASPLSTHRFWPHKPDSSQLKSQKRARFAARQPGWRENADEHRPTPFRRAEYPVPALQPWIVAQSNAIAMTPAAPASDYSHGTFIAGLLASAAQLNSQAFELPLEPVRIVDVRAFSRKEKTTVSDFLARVGDALRDFPQVHVWSISIGLDVPLTGPEFSQMARDLDELAGTYGVLFVVAAGNDLDPTPLRPWPPASYGADDRDRITAPADSMRSLTVGSIAHGDVASGVKKNEPAPYSRRGPAAAAVPKPEVVHYGGNCTLDNQSAGGISSIAPNGNVCIGHGTSYAAPLVASLAAQMWEVLAASGNNPTPSLVKALIVHSAVINSPPRSADHQRYYGFGLPFGISESLMCTDDMFTTFHTVAIPQGREIHHAFPMPHCLLVDGKFVGEIIITLCYTPVLNGANGAEYCRSNVAVSMGPLQLKRDGKVHFTGCVPPDPKGKANAIESALIEHGMIWNPLKVYRKRFPRGVAGTDWELRFDVLYRAGEPIPASPQVVHAIVTLRGLEDGMPVYRDGVRALAKLKHQTTALVTPTQLRV